MTEGAEHLCRVCGFWSDEPPWGDDGRSPSFEYCPCCGVEWGYQDLLPSAAERFRATWLAEGAPWQDRKVPADGLTTDERLRGIGAQPQATEPR
jgi:hypothetical protein